VETFEVMLQDHPVAEGRRRGLYRAALDALAACANACTICADACLGETDHLDALHRRLRLELDCADVCLATARVLARQSETPNEIMRAQLHVCVVACDACAETCADHAERNAHCRRCAEACRHCQERCNFLLGEIDLSGPAELIDPEESPTLVP
jgi:hypothetical protein